MPKTISSGECRLCNATFTKAAISRHLAACLQSSIRDEPAGRDRGTQSRKPFFHLVLEGRYLPHYWLHLAVPAERTLGDLDSVLRAIWLECCGHLSAFRIARPLQKRPSGGYFVSVPEEDEEELKGRPIGQALAPGDHFTYEYDFGSTTELKGRVLAELAPSFPKRKIHLLARNAPPDVRCGQCGKSGTLVCSQCFWEGAGALCDDCAKTHECGEEMLLLVVNSPRMGVCGYCGPSREP